MANAGDNPVNAVDPLGSRGEVPDKFPPHWQGFLDALGGEINPFDPRLAFSRQAISMGDFAKGDWKSAARNSGWAQLEEMGASKGGVSVLHRHSGSGGSSGDRGRGRWGV